MSNRAIIFLAWGEDFVNQVASCVRESQLPDYPIWLITDPDTPVRDMPSPVVVLRHAFQFSGKVRKTELLRAVPIDLETVLFLDVDTRVIADITLGFEKAERHGIAMAPAPHYSLADFRGFRQVMVAEGVRPSGQIVYNSGVIFFAANRPDVRSVFDFAHALALKYPHAPWSDQPYLTLAMEMLEFNPYTLSPSFNYRAFGELVSGSIRIWHSYNPVPQDAANLEPGYLHRYERGKLIRATKVPL